MRLSQICIAIAQLGRGGAWSPADLTSLVAWYDPSDLTTLFQDSAGTTPVAVPGTVADSANPVGLIQDKSGGGRHASQATSTARPLLSARVNLLTYTENFEGGNWSGSGSTGADILDWSIGADKYQWLTLPANTPVRIEFDYSVDSGPDGTFSINLLSGASQNIDATPTVQRYSGVHSTGDANPYFLFGKVTSGTAFRVSRMSVVREADGALPYQSVPGDGSTYDGDPALFPYYLAFDGVDDYLSTSAINLTGTDKVTVFAGAYKGAAPEQILVEFSTNTGLNVGAWYITQPYNSTSVGSAGLGPQHIAVNLVSVGEASVVTFQAEISADLNSLRINAVNGTNATGDQGTGTYGNWPLFIGARSGPSFPFNGNIYSLIIGGALYDAATVLAAETWVADKTGVTL